jgi:hypothetical protein
MKVQASNLWIVFWVYFAAIALSSISGQLG